MAQHALSANFGYFFRRINPSPTVTAQAASEYNSIKRILECDPTLSSALNAQCYLQGSYGWETAIYDINDVDIVLFCQGLYYPAAQGSVSVPGTSWDRDRIFNAVASAMYNDQRYRDKLMPVKTDSMCVKVDLGIKVEILPVVRNSGNVVTDREPFYLWRPERRQWELGFASTHRSYLSAKNLTTAGNFIPMIKVMKHLRTMGGLDAVSFHIESLLYRIDDSQFLDGPAEYIPRVLSLSRASPPTDSINNES
jgi:Second Messenger Oligonucleotide or Dinucleotide Synthetase domain